MQEERNNEYYPEWEDFIRSTGIEIEDDNYEGNITDIMGALTAIEKIVERIAIEKKEDGIDIYDFSENIQWERRFALTDKLLCILDTSYVFMPLLFLMTCRDKIEIDRDGKDGRHMTCYKLKDGQTLAVRAS